MKYYILLYVNAYNVIRSDSLPKHLETASQHTVYIPAALN